MLHGRHPIPLWYCGFDVLSKPRENELGNAEGLTVDVLAHASRGLFDGILGRFLLALRDVFTGFLEELHERDPRLMAARPRLHGDARELLEAPAVRVRVVG